MVSTNHSADMQKVSKKGKETEKPLCVTDYNHNIWWGQLEGPVAAYVHGWMRMTKWYLQLFKRPVQLLLVDKSWEEIYSSSDTEYSLWKVCSWNMHMLQASSMYKGGMHPVTQFQGWLKDTFSEKWQQKPKNQNHRQGVSCVQSWGGDSVYCCHVCDMGLCLEDCSELYHKKFNY